MRLLPGAGHDPVGLDVLPSPFTQVVGSICQPGVVQAALREVDAVIHTATLHKPHVATHRKQDFVDVNVTGTLTLLEEACRAEVQSLVFTSTTSAFGASLTPPDGAPAVWVDEDLPGVPKNIYGVTKTAAEDLCALFHRRHGLPVVVLRTSRFFPEDDDNAATREAFTDVNAKVNELLFRRGDLHDMATAHLCALRRAPELGWAKLIVSATTPFERSDAARLRAAPLEVVRRVIPEVESTYAALSFRLPDTIGRVYDNGRARAALGWQPQHDFASALQQLKRGEPWGSPLAREVGAKGYHPGRAFTDGPYPVD